MSLTRDGGGGMRLKMDGSCDMRLKRDGGGGMRRPPELSPRGLLE